MYVNAKRERAGVLNDDQRTEQSTMFAMELSDILSCGRSALRLQLLSCVGEF